MTCYFTDVDIMRLGDVRLIVRCSRRTTLTCLSVRRLLSV